MKYTTLLITVLIALETSGVNAGYCGAECLKEWTNPTDPGDGTGVRPAVTANAACNYDYDEAKFCGKIWKAAGAKSCCTQDSVIAVRDWLKAQNKKGGKKSENLVKKIKKFEKGEGPAEKSDEIETKREANKDRLPAKAKGDAEKNKQKAAANKAKKAKFTGEGGKAQAKKAAGKFKQCLFFRTQVSLKNLCFLCGSGADQYYDAATNALKVGKKVCENFFKKCARVYAVFGKNTEAEADGRDVLAAKGQTVKELPKLTPEASALLLEIIEADNEETLASAVDKTKTFCSLLTIGEADPAIFGDNTDTDIDGATTRRLLAAERIRRILTAGGSMNYAQVETGGADISNMEDQSGITEEEFATPDSQSADFARIIAGAITIVSLLFSMM